MRQLTFGATLAAITLIGTDGPGFTGVRIRQVPMKPAVVRDALARAG
jgi:hypothetical protein